MPALATTLVALLLLLGAALPAGAASAKKPAESTLEVIRLSREALAAHRADEAVSLLKDALGNEAPTPPQVRSELLAWLGRSYQCKGQYGPARQALDNALRIRDELGACIDAVCVELLADLGNVAMSGGDPDASLAYLQRALSVAEATSGDRSTAAAEIWLLIGGAHMLRDEHHLAERAFRSAIAITEQRQALDDDPLQLALVNLAVTLRKLGREEEAKVLLDRGLASSVKRDPKQ